MSSGKRGAGVGNIPRFTLIPSPRCCAISSRSPLTICNRPAAWMPVCGPSGVTAFWCDLHKEPGATAIAGMTIVRRVSVVGQIVMCSQVGTDELARAEAIARLDRGIRDAGGLLNLHVMTCQTGPWAVPASLGEENANWPGR